MIMPLYDDNSQRIRTPFVNYILIAINIFVFVMFQNFGENERFITLSLQCPQKSFQGKIFNQAPLFWEKPAQAKRLSDLV